MDVKKNILKLTYNWLIVICQTAEKTWLQVTTIILRKWEHTAKLCGQEIGEQSVKQTESSVVLSSAPCASVPAPLSLLINVRYFKYTVTVQLLFTLLNNKIEPPIVTLILNKIFHNCLNMLIFTYVHFSSWVFKIILIRRIDFTPDD